MVLVSEGKKRQILEAVAPDLNSNQIGLILNLPMGISKQPADPTEFAVKLPEWASDIGVGSTKSLSVPMGCSGQNGNWESVDWIRAIWELLICNAEQTHEKECGPIHSYQSRLPEKLWWQSSRPWINRILMFLKRWSATSRQRLEEDLFGAGTSATIYLTHDVDYVKKTWPLRVKKLAFDLWNRKQQLVSLASAFVRSADYWQFPFICNLEETYGVRSIWNFYAGKGGNQRNPKQILFDPGYSVKQPRLRQVIEALNRSGHTIGLHQSYDDWKNLELMKQEKSALEAALCEEVFVCRQHWLRFSHAETWQTQELAGFKLDLTLGFNECISYRNGAALRVPAWIANEERFSSSLFSVPLVMMDSHLYDYGLFDADKRRKKIDSFLDELVAVSGSASVVWHQRVFHRDYGWGADYEYLLSQIRERNIETEVG